MSRLDIVTKIIQRLSSGMSIDCIAREFGVEVEAVKSIHDQALQLSASSLSRSNQKNRHILTDDERRKGWLAGEPFRQKKRDEMFQAILRLVKQDKPALRLATVAYYLAKGSRKEYSVTAIQPDVACMFIQSLEEIGVPRSNISCQWRNAIGTLPDTWLQLETLIPIKYSDSTHINSLRIRVGSFEIEHLKISSRALGRAYSTVGQEVIHRYVHLAD